MAEVAEDKATNGAVVEVVGGDEQEDSSSSYGTKPKKQELTLLTMFNNLITAIMFPEPGTKFSSAPLLYRIRASLSENVPLLREASKNTARHVLVWTRRGSPLRAVLVISVGTITLLAMAGLLVFMLFFIAATLNAILISLLVSLAAAGGFLALFFACVAATYIGILSVAVFVISAATISAIVVVLIATGWIGFFCVVWLATRKSVSLAKHVLSMAGSAVSAYSSGRHTYHHTESSKQKE